MSLNLTIRPIDEHGQQQAIVLEDLPDECPNCHRKGTFNPIYSFLNTKSYLSEVIFRCSNSQCYEVFIGYYKDTHNSGYYNIYNSAPKKYIRVNFSDKINAVSSNFEEIYNQALIAENDSLTEICGPGYRKALEFLIKDYLINNLSDLEEIKKIKNEFLGICIDKRITEERIKAVAKRAVWLGNDETHYVRKWEEKDLQDLKNLINLTVHWIEIEMTTRQLLDDMPE